MKQEGMFFYKYKFIDERFIDRTSRIFTHSEVFFSSVADFNDPFDGKFDFQFDATRAERKNYLDRSIRTRRPNLNRQERKAWVASRLSSFGSFNREFLQQMEIRRKALINSLGVYCLSRVQNDILMWSHYSAAHRGYCLQFVDDPEDKFIGRSLAVNYSDLYPEVNPITEDDSTRFNKSLLTKAKRWEYEREWRIIDYEEGPGLKHFPDRILVGVIFGCRMPEEHKKMIYSWCSKRQPPINFFQAREAAKTYSLDLYQWVRQ